MIGHFTLMVNDKQSKGKQFMRQYFLRIIKFYEILFVDSRLRNGQAYQTYEQLQLQGACSCLQLFLDERLHSARL